MRQACAILHYKEKADRDDILGTKHCHLEDLECQLDLLFQKGFSSMGNWAEMKANRNIHNTLTFGNQTFRVQKKENPDIFRGIFFTKTCFSSLIFWQRSNL